MNDQELEKFYRAYEEMFRTEGWKNLMEDLAQNALQFNSIEACKDDKDLYFRKGQISMVANLLNLKDQIETAKEQVEEDQFPLDNEE